MVQNEQRNLMLRHCTFNMYSSCKIGCRFNSFLASTLVHFAFGNNHVILLIFDNIFFSLGRKDQVPIAVSCDVCIEHQILFLHILLAWVEGGPNYLPNKVKSIRDLRKHGIYERGAHKHTIVFGMHDC